MPVRPVLLYGHPVLAAPNRPVEGPGPELDRLIRDLEDTYPAIPGLGLAAPQIGVNLRVAVADLSAGRTPGAAVVLVNPELIASGGSAALEEGCLSFPGLFTTLRRPRRVVVRARDQSWNVREHTAEGTLAQAFCHELDHLDGILLPDRIRGLRRALFLFRVRLARRRWRRLPAAAYVQPPGYRDRGRPDRGSRV